MKDYIIIFMMWGVWWRSIFVIIFINGNNVFAADTITSTENGSNSASSNVTASYNASGASIVYSVDVTWGAMKWKYSDTSASWNPQTHVYDIDGTGTWQLLNADGTSGTDGVDNLVEIRNHSNAMLTAEITFSPVTEYINVGIGKLTMVSISNRVSESVTNSRYFMGTAYGTENNDSAKFPTPRVSMKLNMSGKAKKYFADNTVIGNVTVTLTE